MWNEPPKRPEVQEPTPKLKNSEPTLTQLKDEERFRCMRTTAREHVEPTLEDPTAEKELGTENLWLGFPGRLDFRTTRRLG